MGKHGGRFLKSKQSQRKVMLTWFLLEVLIERIDYFPMCLKSTVMQVMYNCFITLNLANDVMVFFPASRNVELSWVS